MQQGYVSLINNKFIRDSLFFAQRGVPGAFRGPKNDLNDLGKIGTRYFCIVGTQRKPKNQKRKNEH